MIVTYIFDGSYQGLLTAVFYAFEYKEYEVKLVAQDSYQPAMFAMDREIISDTEKSNRVITGLNKLLSKNNTLDFWKAYLSEEPVVHQIIVNLIIAIFKSSSPTILQNYGNEEVLRFHQTLKKVSRERHRMKAFVRFNKSTDGLFAALIEPDFNVLPLIITFFRNRYADQPWLIYDKRRNYGIYYDLTMVTEVTIPKTSANALQKNTSVDLATDDQRFTNLWQAYFKSTNIEARKNLKLHLRHVPKRYWKYLPEKFNNSL